ncbi:MAG: NAD(P)H-hydrate dehydratase [Cytophagales bacterium]|nr:NAD(P)H-hydrate dehydratase [Cytophagales bacterium]
MKILSAAQTRDADAYTISHEPSSSIDLMERASQAFVDWFVQQYPHAPSVKVFCGLGNNGGDGLAIARLLSYLHYRVEVWVVRYAEATSADFATNFYRLKRLFTPGEIKSEADIPALPAYSLVIDALFGSGLSRPVEGIAAGVVEAINGSGATIVAVDVPSGLFVDAPNAGPVVVKATHTVTFQLPKLSFLLPQNEPYVGEWHVVDIGLHPQAVAGAETPYHYVDENFLATLVRRRPKFAHKGLFGHALLVAGSHGKMGAAVLAARACLRSGVGLLTLHVPWSGYEIMQISAPEAMCLVDTQGQYVSEVGDTTPFNTIGIGPGLGTRMETRTAFKKLLQRTTAPMVMDADALNLLAKYPDLLPLLPPQSVLTPHPKEFERLTDKADNDYHRLALLKEFSRKHQVVVVLKGAHTATAWPTGEVYFNIAGNPGMATGGSGDVLTGIITALVAQYYPPGQAAVLGVYLHALAGNLAAAAKGYSALVASDLIEFLPGAFGAFKM